MIDFLWLGYFFFAKQPSTIKKVRKDFWHALILVNIHQVTFDNGPYSKQLFLCATNDWVISYKRNSYFNVIYWEFINLSSATIQKQQLKSYDFVFQQLLIFLILLNFNNLFMHFISTPQFILIRILFAFGLLLQLQRIKP